MDDEELPDDDSRPLRDMLQMAGGECADCKAAYRCREAVFSIALGFKSAPRCFACLAKRLERDPAELRNQLVRYIRGRECYLIAWREAERRDGAIQEFAMTDETPGDAMAEENILADETWDAGDMGCGELVMALRGRMNSLTPGGVLEVEASDPAAPEDLPAWCRLCGHKLVRMDHPRYWIRRKGD